MHFGCRSRAAAAVQRPVWAILYSTEKHRAVKDIQYRKAYGRTVAKGHERLGMIVSNP